jgi:HAD superfamily hydrolase (TIGR01549 family)
VYFDLDDTLLDHRNAERRALADLYGELIPDMSGQEALSVQRFQQDYHESNVELWRRYSLAEITAEELRHDRFANVCAAHDLKVDPLTLSRRYMQLYSTHWSPIPGALEAFHSIAAETPVGVITNGFAVTQHQKLDQFAEIRSASAAIVISEEFGHMKPSKKLFDHASEQASCSGEKILYVGDSWHSDVEGGLAAGWNVAWFATADQIQSAPPVNGASRLTCFSEWDELVRHCTAG